MRYLPTPFNALALVLLIYAFYTAFADLPVGDGLTKFWVIPAIGMALVFLLIDFFIQRYVSKYKSIFIIEFIIIAVLFMIPRIIGSFNKANTLYFNPKSDKPYCVMIYDVKNAEEVFINGNRDVPSSGVLFNTKKQGEKQRNVHLSGEQIIANSSFDDVLNCNSKSYNYRAYFIIIDKNRTYDEDSLKLEIKKQLLTQCDVIANLESGK